MNWASVSESSAQMMTRIERPIATMARFFPRRRAMRRYRSPRKVSVRAALTAASPTMRARYRLPLPVPGLPVGRPADSLTPGANRAHEVRCAGVGKPGHVGADLGQDHLRGDRSNAGNRVELGHRRCQVADLCVDA